MRYCFATPSTRSAVAMLRIVESRGGKLQSPHDLGAGSKALGVATTAGVAGQVRTRPVAGAQGAGGEVPRLGARLRVGDAHPGGDDRDLHVRLRRNLPRALR